MEKNYSIKDDCVIIKVNSQIYSKEVIMQTTYVMLDEFYFLVDLVDLKFEVMMKFKESEKNEQDLENAAYKFFDELIESSSYINQMKRTSKIRQTILEGALIPQIVVPSQGLNEEDDGEEIETEEVDDEEE